MALPGSGTLTLEMIRAEFGGGYPIALSQYYRGGGLVPNTGTNAAVPTSGAISVSNFYGAANYTPMSLGKSGDAYGSNFTTVAGGNVSVTTDSVTISVSNGLGPFSYSWSYLSGASAGVGSPSSATTTFSRTAAAPVVDGENVVTGYYRCTVTDATSATATIDVYVQTTHIYVAL